MSDQLRMRTPKEPHTTSPTALPLSTPHVHQHTPPIQAYQHIQTHPRTLVHHDVLVLQRTVGNQAVQRLLARQGQGQIKQPEQETSASRQSKKNTTGLPDRLKATLEASSGIAMDDVHVHYHASQPAQLQASAYTQGTDIYVGSGQEKHLAHEAWHVAQQKQGRVKPALQMKGMGLNHDFQLEQEADAFSAHYAQYTGLIPMPIVAVPSSAVTHATAQFKIEKEENIKFLEELLQSLGVPPSSGDYIKILYHAIHTYDDSSIEEAKRYIWDMASTYRGLETSESSFEPRGHPRHALLHTMDRTAQSDVGHLYHGIYRQTFERLPQQELLHPHQYLDILARVADRQQQAVRFAPQGRERESFRSHYQSARQQPDTPAGRHSAQLLLEAKAMRILPRNPSRTSPGQQTLARITVTLHPLLLEFALNALTELFTRHPVINNFKVMGANTLGQGPDDVVLYLNDLMTSDAVRRLIADLNAYDVQCWRQNDQGFLRESAPPIGMQQLGRGIYGADMPGDAALNRKAQGSHGMNMALIMSDVLASSRGGMPREHAFELFFRRAELNVFNPAFSNILIYDDVRLRMGQAASVNMNCFIDSIIQVASLDRRLVPTIAQGLNNAGIRDIGQMIETHSDAMNAIIAEIDYILGVSLTVRIISQNPFTGRLTHMDVGNGRTRVYIFYSHLHFIPLFF
jgi:hypothetical protein